MKRLRSFEEENLAEKRVKLSDDCGDADAIHPTEWFMDIVGVTENELRKMKHKPITDAGDGYLEITNLQTKKKTKAGRFTVELLGQLENSLTGSTTYKKVPIEIISRPSYDHASVKFVDVAYQQSLSENRNAVFQVASNFNGVEASSEEYSPDHPKFTEEYIWDRTQGPAASVSAGAAAITRVHCAFYENNKPQSSWSQTTSRQCLFLGNIANHFPTKNGYVILNGKEPKFPTPHDKDWEDMLKQVCIGYHKDVQVTYGHRNKLMVRVNEIDQVIDQVFCAAVNISQGKSGKRNQKVDNIESKCMFALEAAYSGVYLAALANKRKKIVLTLIGGGAFCNKKKWIYRAILSAHLKWAGHESSCLEKVVILLYRSDELKGQFLSDLENNSVPYSYILYKNGERTIVRQILDYEETASELTNSDDDNEEGEM